MKRMKAAELATGIRFFARCTLLLLGSVVFLFALVSGSEGFGGGIQGILKNSPNALPWLLLLVLLYVAWKNELIGGILITILGIFLIYFFNFSGPNFFMATFLLTVFITVLGILFIVSWYLRKD